MPSSASGADEAAGVAPLLLRLPELPFWLFLPIRRCVCVSNALPTTRPQASAACSRFGGARANSSAGSGEAGQRRRTGCVLLCGVEWWQCGSAIACVCVTVRRAQRHNGHDASPSLCGPPFWSGRNGASVVSAARVACERSSERRRAGGVGQSATRFTPQPTATSTLGSHRAGWGGACSPTACACDTAQRGRRSP